MNNFWFAFSLTLLAGLSTGIGSTIAFFAKTTNTKFLSVSLGFSAGVMIYVSMIEIFPKAQESLTQYLGPKQGAWATVGAFFGGMLLIALIDHFIPSEENPHSMYRIEDFCDGVPCPEPEEGPDNGKSAAGLTRVGLFTALVVAIHNFPEGLATFVTALKNPTMAIPIAVAIAIHNIPEGIAVSVPILYGTGDKKKAFVYSFLSGLSEPIGALVGYLLLWRFMSDLVFGVIFAGVAGIMVFISIDELLPSAQEYGEHHLSIYGLLGGMAVMALSLLLFI